MVIPPRRDISLMTPQEIEKYTYELIHCMDTERDAWHAQNPLPPSVRRPSLHLGGNEADQIEIYMREDSHRAWGWVVMRCYYDDDNEWREFISCLRSAIQHSLEYFNGADIFDRHELTVIEDANTLDGATVSRTREVFAAWQSDAAMREQQSRPAQSQRYRFYLHIDKASAQEVIATACAGDNLKSGCINLVSAEYGPGTIGGRIDRRQYEPIEGIQEWHVGWLRFRYTRYVNMYYNSRDSDSWFDLYARPPEISGDLR